MTAAKEVGHLLIINGDPVFILLPGGKNKGAPFTAKGMGTGGGK